MRRYCLALDLKDDEPLIQQYEKHHQNVPGEIIKSITGTGIVALNIYRTGNRLMMVMETTDDFSFEKKADMDTKNEHVQRWEALMWRFQQALPWAKEGEKWMLMKPIFSLPEDTV